ncbi:MAG: DUF885 domain-containing protein [Lachnospiraceae bacterium]|nr:DUF885 domain-containing protein [Lachnospiraceae bacterium]
MIHKKSLSRRQLALTCCLLFIFTGLIILLFGYRRDEKLFLNITSRLFRAQMAENTLNMHYTLAYPEDFGIYDYAPVLPCYDAQNTLSGQAASENLLSALDRLNAENLPDEQHYSYTLLHRYLENSLALSCYPYYEEPLSPSSGMQSQLPILLAEYTFRKKQDVEDYLALLDQTDEYFASLLLFEQEKSRAGLFMPASSLEAVIEQCDTIVTKNELEDGSHFLQTTFEERLQILLEKDVISPAEAQSYLADNNRLLSTVLAPAYEDLADGLFLLTDDTIPLEGLAAKPEGREYYALLVISRTGSYRDIPQIKELLLDRFSQEYDAIRDILKKHPELISAMSKEDSQAFPFRTSEDMLAHLKLRMEEDFPPLPKDSFGTSLAVKAVSPNLEEYCAPAFYLTPPIDDTDNNVIYINEKDSPQGLRLYTTLAHEGYPGHLYQTVYSNRHIASTKDNYVRQLLWYGGYLEGWALYVEFLSYDYASVALSDAGFEEEALLAQLEKHNRSMQLCLYSLLDIMIHYENASYSQVEKVLSHFGIENPASIEAVYSYIVEEPCNYLKYYVGYLEILELQKDARSLWGDAYSDYAFHTFYLECGPSDFTSLKERLKSSSSSMLSR